MQGNYKYQIQYIGYLWEAVRAMGSGEGYIGISDTYTIIYLFKEMWGVNYMETEKNLTMEREEKNF